MKDIGLIKPVKEKYRSNYEFIIDLLIYYFKKYQIFWVIAGIIILVFLISILILDYNLKIKEEKATVELEKIYDKIELFITQSQNISNYEKIKEELISNLNIIEKKSKFTKVYNRIVYYKGLIFFIDGKYEDSIKEFKKIYSNKSFHAYFLANIGIIRSYMQLNDLDNAIKYSKKLYNNNKNNVYGAYGAYFLGFLYKTKGDILKSIQYYNIVEANFSNSNFSKDSKYFLLEKQLNEIINEKYIKVK
ncbi:MAG: hypothetical protein N3A58_01340 [Spirochaetes bacterium]|nr:hypothetical protein [Spirochaetota bacterium]